MGAKATQDGNSDLVHVSVALTSGNFADSMACEVLCFFCKDILEVPQTPQVGLARATLRLAIGNLRLRAECTKIARFSAVAAAIFAAPPAKSCDF